MIITRGGPNRVSNLGARRRRSSKFYKHAGDAEADFDAFEHAKVAAEEPVVHAWPWRACSGRTCTTLPQFQRTSRVAGVTYTRYVAPAMASKFTSGAAPPTKGQRIVESLKSLSFFGILLGPCHLHATSTAVCSRPARYKRFTLAALDYWCVVDCQQSAIDRADHSSAAN